MPTVRYVRGLSKLKKLFSQKEFEINLCFKWVDWILLVVLLKHLTVLNKCQRYILKMYRVLNKKWAPSLWTVDLYCHMLELIKDDLNLNPTHKYVYSIAQVRQVYLIIIWKNAKIYITTANICIYLSSTTRRGTGGSSLLRPGNKNIRS